MLNGLITVNRKVTFHKFEAGEFPCSKTCLVSIRQILGVFTLTLSLELKKKGVRVIVYDDSLGWDHNLGPGLQDYRAPPRTPNVMRFSLFFLEARMKKTTQIFYHCMLGGAFLASKGWSLFNGEFASDAQWLPANLP